MKKIDQVVIGALLHDIGKFSQRAKIPNKYLKDDSEKQRVCKTNKDGYFSYYHSLYTSLFMEENKKYFPAVEEQFEKKEDNFINFASCHHNPRTDIGKIVSVADSLSSGMDRIDLEDNEADTSFRKERLISIFSGINLTENEAADSAKKTRYVHHVCPLDYENKGPKDIFPFPEETKEDLSEQYLINWNSFLEEFRKIPKNNFFLFFYMLKYLLEKYTWCIPSSTINLQDISLYDHLYTTSAIAAAIYQYHEETGFNDADISNKEIKKFILISGDLSGIQKYIYNIYGNSLKGSAKILRSRSLFIEILNEISSRYLTELMGLHPANLFYSIGGKFLLIAPNTESTLVKLSMAEKEISKWFFKKFKAELSVNIAGIELSGKDLDVKNFADKFRELLTKIELRKKNKFSSVLFEDYSPGNFIFEEDYSKYSNGSCSFCGKEPAELSSAEDKSDDEKLGLFCRQLKDVGEKLPFASYIAFSKIKIKGIQESFEFFDEKFFVYLLDKKQKINEKDFFEIYSFKSHETYPLKLITGHIPSDEKGALSFENIAEKSCSGNAFVSLKNDNESDVKKLNENKFGQKLLGVIRADVDNMGFIFSYGFMNQELKDRLSISRFFSMSRMFNSFFNGYLSNSISQKDSFRDIYTVYAGGDDLFLIGPWDTIIDFAVFMAKNFEEFTCRKKDITISASIGLFKPSFPVKRFASKTGEMLEKAKTKELAKKDEKIKLHGNKIFVFGKAVSWNDFYSLIDNGIFIESELTKNRIYGSSKITPSFIYRLIVYFKMQEEYEQTKKVESLKYKSLANYDIARNIVEKGEKDEIRNETLVKKIFELVFQENNMKNLIIPLTWAIYRTRKSN